MRAELPRLRRKKALPKAGIVHLGLGAFFRAHGALYIEEAMAKSGGDWGIIGVSLQSPRMHDLLAPQDFSYTARQLGATDDMDILQHVEVITDVLVAREDPEAVLSAMADPAIRIVSLTVTEKGYCHDPATGKLNSAHPGIQADLINMLPVSAPGYLVRALQRRKAAGIPPFTVLTCDNLPDNGRLVRAIVLEFARSIDSQLADWIEAECRFPATMVDRIVPATTAEDVDNLAVTTGCFDAAPVVHEPFRQWVIEDDFVPAFGEGRRPFLEDCGVEFVESVTRHEHMKLRMLNGTHSALAYLGYLAGHKTISETVADPVLAAFVKNLWRKEIIPSLEAPPEVDLEGYAATLLNRYANPSIRHLTWQIAMDGSQKLPQRILGTVKDNLAAGRPCPGLVTAIAAWMIYASGRDLSGNPIDVRDPLAARLATLSMEASPAESKVEALLSVREIFDETLSAKLQEAVTHAFTSLCEKGVHETLKALT